MSARLPADQAARDEGARRFDVNLVVVAGAGSGKTTLLVERLLNLCLGEGVPLAQVAALTFTEKAAAEMRERVALQLSELLAALRGSPSPAAAVARLEAGGAKLLPAARSLAWVSGLAPGATGRASVADVHDRAIAALEDLDAGVVGTIHSFCSELVRRHPREARIDAAFEIDDRRGVAGLFDEEWERFQDEELGPAASRADLWRRVLTHVDLGAVKDVAFKLVTHADGVTGDRARARAMVLERLADVVARGERVLAQELSPKFQERLTVITRLLSLYALEGENAFRKAFDAVDTTWLDSKFVSPGKKCADPDAASEAAAEGVRWLKRLAAVRDELAAALVEAVAPLGARLAERCQREGVMSFDGLLLAARDLLRDHPHVRRSEIARFRAVLLDEFQDTDPLRYEIAFLLADSDRACAGRDAWSASLTPGRLFLVGDPKQSIYRFRGADMAAYERALERLRAQGGKLLSLTANFRSRAEVLGPVNQLCGRIIVEAPPYQPAYEDIEACRADAVAGASRVEVVTVRHAGTGAEDGRNAEARALARLLDQWTLEGRIKSPGDVAVLFRSMTDIALYQRALADANVHFVTLGGKTFAERDEIVGAIALLRCLTRPNDAAALLAVLRGPACGASDLELARFAAMVREPGSGAAWTFRCARRLPPEADAQAPLVARALRGLDALASHAARLPTDEALRLVLAHQVGEGEGDGAWAPRVLELNAASYGGAQRLANLEKLVQRGVDLSGGDGLTLARVAEQLEGEMRMSDEGESPLADEKVEAMKLMTVHQAKGLEFPVVVLPDVARQLPARRPKTVELVDGHLSIALTGGPRNLASLLAEDVAARHDEAERARLVYVAMTRAMEWLVLLNGNPRPKSNTWPAPALAAHWGYDPASDAPVLLGGAVVHRLVEDGDVKASPPRGPTIDALANAVRAQDAAAARMDAARAGRPRSATSSADERTLHALAEAVTVEPLEGGEHDAASPAAKARIGASLARAIGVAAHVALERWDFADERALDALGRRAAAIAAAEVGVEAADVERALRPILASLAASDLVARVRKATVLARELPFLLKLEGVPWQGSVDLVIEEAGRTWVLDWKTDRDLEPERHRAQLEVYGEAVRRWRRLTGVPGLALGHLGTGRWVTLAEPR